MLPHLGKTVGYNCFFMPLSFELRINHRTIAGKLKALVWVQFWVVVTFMFLYFKVLLESSDLMILNNTYVNLVIIDFKFFNRLPKNSFI